MTLIFFLIAIAILVVGLSLKNDSKFKKSKGRKKTASIEIAENSKYSPVSLLNDSEKIVYKALIQSIKSLEKTYFVYPQVSLGEIIKVDKGGLKAFNIVNSKRCDFLIVNIDFNPIMAIEYHGTGHFKGNYSNRDKVKEIALNKAGIKYEVIHYKNDGNIKEYIENEILPLLKN